MDNAVSPMHRTDAIGWSEFCYSRNSEASVAACPGARQRADISMFRRRGLWRRVLLLCIGIEQRDVLALRVAGFEWLTEAAAAAEPFPISEEQLNDARSRRSALLDDRAERVRRAMAEHDHFFFFDQGFWPSTGPLPKDQQEALGEDIARLDREAELRAIIASKNELIKTLDRSDEFAFHKQLAAERLLQIPDLPEHIAIRARKILGKARVREAPAPLIDRACFSQSLPRWKRVLVGALFGAAMGVGFAAALSALVRPGPDTLTFGEGALYLGLLHATIVGVLAGLSSRS